MMKAAILQYDIALLEVEANLAKAEKLMDEVAGADIYLLPEMFATGYCLDAEKLTREISDRSVEWLMKQAAQRDAAIGAGVAYRDGETLFNSFVLAQRDGSRSTYDKRHLFGEEKDCFSAGRSVEVMDCNGVKIRPLICYDLRFPIWSRGRGEYDVLVYSANWPEARVEQWDCLLRARAIENQCYTIGVNRVGSDSTACYAGHSAVYDFRGGAVGEVLGNEECCVAFSLDIEELHSARRRFSVLADADDCNIEF